MIAASMEGIINFDINESSNPPKDSSLSDGEIADPKHDATKPTSTVANASGRKSLPDLAPKPNSASSGAPPFKSHTTRQSEHGVSETSETSSLLQRYCHASYYSMFSEPPRVSIGQLGDPEQRFTSSLPSRFATSVFRPTDFD